MGSKKGIPRGKYKTKILQPDGKVICDSCGKPYQKKSSLLVHFRTKHLKIRQTCTFCAKKFISRSILNRHQKNVHGVKGKISTIRKNHTSSIKTPSFVTNDTHPSLANVLSMKQNDKYGIHIIANKDIDAGQPVLIAPPFACVKYLVNTGEGCFQCNKRTKTKIRCRHCIDTWFCSNLCMAGQAHRKRCDTNFVSSDCHKIRLIAEIITTAFAAFDDADAFFDFSLAVLFGKTNQCQPAHSEYAEILKLNEDVDPGDAALAQRVANIIAERPSFEGRKRDLFTLAYHHANILNVYTFSEQITCSNGGAFVRYYIHGAISRFNHSCEPNVELYLDNDDITRGIASRRIKSGEQLFISYFGDNTLDLFHSKDDLKETWNFQCECSKCL